MRLYDRRAGDFRELRPGARLGLRVRSSRSPAFLRGALACLGFAPEESEPVDVHFGEKDEPGLWLKPGPVTGTVPEPAVFALLCLRARYREPLAITPASASAAAAELRELRARAAALEAAKTAPNASGLTAYRRRFREALADDLDGAGALDALWDALRPGALSPGSQLSFLREAEGVFGLRLFHPY